ncbi:hypothetical protein F5148DRAFT_971847 [Russula earlei]|uniref:Uncharacterized protein n=1 Tax=Russula earlei TaxID=71964 RepID=A0ACC0UP29_9AGAM|nr:hypothetical protein F5148DRAFT_971847 [Russula earlei]
MSSDLPIDFSNPVIRDHMSLISLQILTPLSLLISVATTLLCSFILRPSLGDVTRNHPASISPSVPAIAAYIFTIYLGQLGYCILLVFTRKPETKSTIVKGVGPSLVFANWVMAGWAITWVFEAFLASTVLLGILSILLMYSNVVLIVYHVPSWHRPLDIGLHPCTCPTLLNPATVNPISIFSFVCYCRVCTGTRTQSSYFSVTIGHTWDPAHPDNIGRYQWEGFAYILAVNFVGAIIIAVRSDWVWCIGATWVCISMWLKKPKPVPIYVHAIMFTALHPIILLGTVLAKYFVSKRQEGRIRLAIDDEETRQGITRGGHEVQADWS